MWGYAKQNLVLIEQSGRPLLLYLLQTAPYDLMFALGCGWFDITTRYSRLKQSRYVANRLAAAPALSSALIILGVIGGVFFSTHLNSHYRIEPVTYASSAPKPAPVKKQSPALLPSPRTMPASTPTKITIPSVGIEAPLVPTDIGYDGSIAVPNTPYQAGWYKRSPTPGELGPSIVVGHVDYLTGIAVFWRLRYVQPGAEIYINRADGSTAKFQVDMVQQYSQSNFPDSKVYGNINYAGVRLITCGGVFDTNTHHYSDNTVVYGTLE
jgi:sortase (surface protein transpeptidase)